MRVPTVLYHVSFVKGRGVQGDIIDVIPAIHLTCIDGNDNRLRPEGFIMVGDVLQCRPLSIAEANSFFDPPRTGYEGADCIG